MSHTPKKNKNEDEICSKRLMRMAIQVKIQPL